MTFETESPEKLELKYCEGCGALTLRSAGSDSVYCAPCRLRFQEIAKSRKERRHDKKPD